MNLRTVRKKIKSVKNVKKITKAMQLISSVKMKKAQEKALEGRPYREALQKMIERVSDSEQMKESRYIVRKKSSSGKKLTVFISSNKGLSGAFLTSLDRYVIKKVDYDNTDFVTVGKKGAMFLGITKGNVVADFTSAHPEIEASAILQYCFEAFVEKNYDTVTVIYNKFINTMNFETTEEQLLPIEDTAFQGSGQNEGSGSTSDESAGPSAEGTYLIEPFSQEVVDSLLHSYLVEKLRGAILNSEAAEHSARMIAMKNATENANDVIYQLTLEGNKLRQAKITNELLDMVTAKESVESS